MRRSGLAVRATVLVVSALVAGTAVLALGSRPDLENARERVDAAWSALRPGLDERYLAVTEAVDAAREEPLGAGSSLLAALNGVLTAWQDDAPIETQVATANRLEGLIARLESTVAATPRLRASTEIAAALAEAADADPVDARAAYNQAVAAYEEVRGGFPRRLVAGALGFDTRRTLEIPA